MDPITAPKRILAAVACTALVVLVPPARADEYRAGDFLNLDLSRAVLSPKRLGPPTEFAPVAVEARTDAKQIVAEPKAGPRPIVRTAKVKAARVVKPSRVVRQAQEAKPRGAARTKVVRRHSNPLDAQAMDTRIQTWPCTSGGICNWKR
jgi:hypothetical protein